MHRQCEIQVRVRYCETDPMGYLHHSHYFVYFEMGRTELLRLNGLRYRDCEEAGIFFVVVQAEAKFKAPARYDDLLTVRTTLRRMTRARIEHEYEVLRDGRLICVGRTVLACVGRDGSLREIPERIRGGQNGDA